MIASSCGASVAAPDITHPDAAYRDSAYPDSTSGDSTTGDSTAPDAASPDAAVPDGALPDSAALDSGLDAGIGPMSPCGTVSVVADDFSDPGLAPQWWPSSSHGMTLGEDSGQLVMTLADSQGGLAYASYTSAFAVYLRDDALSVEAVALPSPLTEAEAGMSFDSVDGRYSFSFIASGGSLVTGYRVDGVRLDDTEAYDAHDHRWWRIAESAGAISFDVSPDGESWSSLRTVTSNAEQLLGYASLWAGTYQAEVAPGEVRFDNVCAGPSPSRWCPAEAFQDRFDDGALDQVWNLEGSTDCSLVEADGVLTISVGNQHGFNCLSYTWTGYTLEQGAITLQIAGHEAHDAVLTGLILRGNDGLYLEAGLLGADVYGYTSPTGRWAQFTNEGWSWLRLSQAGTVLAFEFSADGASWVHRFTLDAGAAFDLFEVGLGVLHDTDVSSGDLGPVVAASFDDYNVAP